jgi:hypothetical protein
MSNTPAFAEQSPHHADEDDTRSGIVYRFGADAAAEFSAQLVEDVAQAVTADLRCAALGPGARARLLEHARVLSHCRALTVIGDQDRAEAVDRIVADVLRGL